MTLFESYSLSEAAQDDPKEDDNGSFRRSREARRMEPDEARQGGMVRWWLVTACWVMWSKWSKHFMMGKSQIGWEIWELGVNIPSGKLLEFAKLKMARFEIVDVPNLKMVTFYRHACLFTRG